MAYTTLLFLLFVIGTFVLYFAVPQKYRWIVLLAASYVFYLSYGVKLAAYILFTTLTIYGAALWMGKAGGAARP